MILQVHTEKELIGLVESLKKEIEQLRTHNKSVTKELESMQLQIDKKPSVKIKETVIKEIEKPTVIIKESIKTDPSIMPTLKKISERLKHLESAKPEFRAVETVIKEIEKPTIIKETVIKTDVSILPTLKKLSDRLKFLENREPATQIIKELTTHEIKTVDEAIKKEIECIKKSILEIKPKLHTTNTVVKEIEKPTVIKETVIKTDPSVMPTLKKLSERLKILEAVKPQVSNVETVVKEIEKPTIIKETVIKTDASILPTLKKLSERLKALESKKTAPQIIKELTTHEVKTVDAAVKKEIEDIKKSILNIKPVVNNITNGIEIDDVLELIKKHVTLLFINKLYGQ
jgi:hypothetical protein